MNSDIRFGVIEAWQPFYEKYANLISSQENLLDLIRCIFLRKFEPRNISDTVVYGIGRLCVEDFWEIFLLCGNGFGTGSMKILRGLYERVVDADYIHFNPNEAEDYADYYWVRVRKLLNALPNGHPQDEKVRCEAERSYLGIKEKFQVRCCDRCDEKKENYSWCTRDLIARIHAVHKVCKDSTLLNLLAPGYYKPMDELHNTMNAIVDRVDVSDSGRFRFKKKINWDVIDSTLYSSQLLLLHCLETQTMCISISNSARPNLISV